MASLKQKFGDALLYQYVEFSAPEAQAIVRDFNIKAHPEEFLLDKDGRLLAEWRGVASEAEITDAVNRALGR